MKRLQIDDHNINIGHCKVYSTDSIFYGSSNFSISNSEFRILNSEFRISKKLLCIENCFLEMPHQGPCTGWGLLI